MRSNTDLVLGGMGAVAEGLGQFAKHQEGQKPLSAHEQLLYKVAMGELDPATAALMAKTGQTELPSPQTGPGLSAAVPPPPVQGDHTNVSLAPGMSSDALSPTAMAMAGQRPMPAPQPTPPGARINPMAGPPAPRSGLGAPTRQDLASLMQTVGTVGPLVTSRRNLQREAIRQNALDGRTDKLEGGRDRRLFTTEGGKNARQEASLGVKREGLAQDESQFVRTLKFKYDSLRSQKDMLTQRLDAMVGMNNARIGSDQRVAAAREIIRRVNAIEDNIAQIDTSINSLAKDPNAAETRAQLQQQLKELTDVYGQETSLLQSLMEDLKGIAGQPAPRAQQRQSTTTRTTGTATQQSGGGQVGAQQPQAAAPQAAIPQTADEFFKALGITPTP